MDCREDAYGATAVGFPVQLTRVLGVSRDEESRQGGVKNKIGDDCGIARCRVQVIARLRVQVGRDVNGVLGFGAAFVVLLGGCFEVREVGIIIKVDRRCRICFFLHIDIETLPRGRSDGGSNRSVHCQSIHNVRDRDSRHKSRKKPHLLLLLQLLHRGGRMKKICLDLMTRMVHYLAMLMLQKNSQPRKKTAEWSLRCTVHDPNPYTLACSPVAPTLASRSRALRRFTLRPPR